jgi:phosphoglycolate phosphatase
LKEFGFAGYFKAVITAFDKFNLKPCLNAIIECSRRLRIRTSEYAAVGDSVVDIKAGKDAGAKTVAVLTGIFSRDEPEKEEPDVILESAKKLPDFLE